MTPAARVARRRWRPAVVAWWLWALVMLGLAVVAWLDQLLRRAGRPDLAVLTADAAAFAVGVVSAVTVGALLASRRPAHPVGWLLLALGLSVAASGVATGYASYGLLARPGTLPGGDYAALYRGVSVLVWAACIGFVLLLTPTGSLPSPRWRWWARIAAAAPLLALVSTWLLPLDPPYRSVANPLAVAALTGPLRVVNAVTWVATGLAIPVAAWSLVVRFRRAGGVQRLQLRWLALAAGLVVAVVAAGVALAALVPTGNEVLFGWLSAVCVALLPLATGAAILRYRLYDLDRIISRTLAYGLLTVLLGGGYAGVVVGLGQLLGRDSSLAVAVATLAVAAAFQPARRRIQQLADRRFDRRRYDAAQTIQAFSARLRDQVDLDSQAAELLGVVEQTMQPTRVSLWLRPSGSAPQDQRTTGASHAASQPAASPSVRAGS